jgi:PEP-CTERM motif
MLAGVAVQPAQATTVFVDPVNFSVAVATDPGSFSVCNTMSNASVPCASGPASATISLLLPPSGEPDGSPYSGSAAATVGGSPAPALMVTATATAAQLEEGDEDPLAFSAGASITYYFELTQIAGAPDSSGIPVLMNGSSSLSVQYSNSDDTTTSSVSMMVTAATPADDPDTNYSLSTSNNGPFFQSFNIVPNVEYEVVMGASATAAVAATDDSSPSLTSTASIDPTFTVSPDDASDFALIFSSGIGNSSESAAPEPSTWAMMLIGFGSVGGALQFRRRRAAVSRWV